MRPVSRVIRRASDEDELSLHEPLLSSSSVRYSGSSDVDGIDDARTVAARAVKGPYVVE